VPRPLCSVPLERRRARREESDSISLGRPLSPVARREGDFARIRVQHWIALADAALSQDWQAKGKEPIQHIGAPGRNSKNKKKVA